MVLRPVPRAREGGPRERRHLLGVGREDSEWGLRIIEGTLPEDVEDRASRQPVFRSLRLPHTQRGRKISFQV